MAIKWFCSCSWAGKRMWQSDIQHHSEAKVIWQKGHIATAHGRFNRIHQVAPMCTPCNFRSQNSTVPLSLTTFKLFGKLFLTEFYKTFSQLLQSASSDWYKTSSLLFDWSKMHQSNILLSDACSNQFTCTTNPKSCCYCHLTNYTIFGVKWLFNYTLVIILHASTSKLFYNTRKLDRHLRYNGDIYVYVYISFSFLPLYHHWMSWIQWCMKFKYNTINTTMHAEKAAGSDTLVTHW